MNPHYAYLYDDFLSDRAYERVLANIETRLSVLGIQGRVARLAIFRSARELVEELVRDGAGTIVVVGNDHTMEKIMWFCPDLAVTIGYIPVCEPSQIGAMLGLPQGEAACNVLAARRIEAVDVGTIDDRYFLTEVRMERTKAAVDIEGRYRLSPRRAGTVIIRNLWSDKTGQAEVDARDGLLDVIIRPLTEAPTPTRWPLAAPMRLEPETALTMLHGAIRSDEPVDVLVDGHRVNGFTFQLGILPRKLKIITGRGKRMDPLLAGSTTPTLPLPESPRTAIVSRAHQALRRVRTILDGWRNWYTR
ncbi:MAG: hypothetical protein RL141_526 [Candidatus Parcubacteria bacterium]